MSGIDYLALPPAGVPDSEPDAPRPGPAPPVTPVVAPFSGDEPEVLAAVWDLAADAMALSDAEGIVLKVNPAYCALYGYPPDALVGHSFAVIFAEPDRAAAEVSYRSVFQSGGVLESFESVVYRSDGSQRIVEARATFLTQDGQRVAMLSLIRDITERTQDAAERKAEEARQRFLAQATAELTAALDWEATLATLTPLLVPAWADACTVDVVDPSGEVRRVAVAGADPATQARVEELQRRFPVDPGVAGSRRALASGETLWWPEVPDSFLSAARDAAHQAILTELAPRSMAVVPFLARGRAIGTLALLYTDSGRRYQLADRPILEELARRAGLALDNARLYRVAQEASATRDQFLTVAAHELKTPLTALLAGVQSLQRRLVQTGVLRPVDVRALQIVADQSWRLNRLVTDLFDLSRLTSGHLHLERKVIDLGALTRRVVAELTPTLERHSVTLDGADGALWVEGDEMRLEQVLHNLLQNAVKYSPAGGTIGVCLQAEGVYVWLRVRDRGLGIPAGALPHLFDPFYRAPNVAARSISGLGIGLYVTRQIVGLHGGEVMVESQEGQGSTFTVRLPRCAAVPGESAVGGL